MQRTGLSRSTIYLRIAHEKSPRPVSLGGQAVGGVDSEVDAWISAQIEESRKPPAETVKSSSKAHR